MPGYKYQTPILICFSNVDSFILMQGVSGVDATGVKPSDLSFDCGDFSCCPPDLWNAEIIWTDNPENALHLDKYEIAVTVNGSPIILKNNNPSGCVINFDDESSTYTMICTTVDFDVNCSIVLTNGSIEPVPGSALVGNNNVILDSITDPDGNTVIASGVTCVFEEDETADQHAY